MGVFVNDIVVLVQGFRLGFWLFDRTDETRSHARGGTDHPANSELTKCHSSTRSSPQKTHNLEYRLTVTSPSASCSLFYVFLHRLSLSSRSAPGSPNHIPYGAGVTDSNRGGWCCGCWCGCLRSVCVSCLIHPRLPWDAMELSCSWCNFPSARHLTKLTPQRRCDVDIASWNGVVVRRDGVHIVFRPN